MIVNLQGIVLKTIKYKESSIITQIFTDDYGLSSFIVNGIRSARSKRGIGYFQPFSILELVAYIKPNREIQQLSEFKYHTPTPVIHTDIRKSTIVLFLSEVLSKMLYHEKGVQKDLYHFLANSIVAFDHLQLQIENFHLHFLLKLMPFVGLQIHTGDELLESMELGKIEHDQQLIVFLSRLISMDISEPIQATGTLRVRALELILQYYEHHTGQIGEIKSLKVLHTVFN